MHYNTSETTALKKTECRVEYPYGLKGQDVVYHTGSHNEEIWGVRHRAGPMRNDTPDTFLSCCKIRLFIYYA